MDAPRINRRTARHYDILTWLSPRLSSLSDLMIDTGLTEDEIVETQAYWHDRGIDMESHEGSIWIAPRHFAQAVQLGELYLQWLDAKGFTVIR